MPSGRLEAHCFDGKKRLCHIRGKMRKRVWVNQGDIVLIGLRDFQDGKADVILKYSADEARNLKNMKELPDNGECFKMHTAFHPLTNYFAARINETGTIGSDDDADCTFVFDDIDEI